MEELFEIFANVGDASFAIDQNQHILFWNSAAERLLGIKAEEAIGLPCWQVLKGETWAERPFCSPNCPLLQAMKHNQPVKAFCLLVRKSAQESVLTNMSTLFVPPELESTAVLIHLQRRPEMQFQWPESF